MEEKERNRTRWMTLEATTRASSHPYSAMALGPTTFERVAKGLHSGCAHRGNIFLFFLSADKIPLLCFVC